MLALVRRWGTNDREICLRRIGHHDKSGGVVLFAHTKRHQRTSSGESAVNHYSRELFETHSLDQVRSADLCRQPPVLVEIKFAVSIEDS